MSLGDKVKALLEQGKLPMEVKAELGCSYATVLYHKNILEGYPPSTRVRDRKKMDEAKATAKETSIKDLTSEDITIQDINPVSVNVTKENNTGTIKFMGTKIPWNMEDVEFTEEPTQMVQEQEQATKSIDQNQNVCENPPENSWELSHSEPNSNKNLDTIMVKDSVEEMTHKFKQSKPPRKLDLDVTISLVNTTKREARDQLLKLCSLVNILSDSNSTVSLHANLSGGER
jgi:hypothetical protein